MEILFPTDDDPRDWNESKRLVRRHNLQRAKLIDTRKGPGGGSRLSRSAARINLAEVYSAVDHAELFAMPRRKPNGNCPVGYKIQAVLKPVFCSAEDALERDLAGIILAMLMASIRGRGTSGRASRARGEHPIGSRAAHA